MREIKVHRSKVDLWLIAILAVSVLLPLGLAVIFPSTFLLTALILTPVLALFAWLFTTTKYEIRGDDLHVSSGPVKLNVQISQITSVKTTRNPLSSPALSLDRLEIRYGDGKRTLISPKDKSGFLSDIGWTDSV